MLLLLLPILLPKIHEIRNFESLNCQKLIVTDQRVRGFRKKLSIPERKSSPDVELHNF